MWPRLPSGIPSVITPFFGDQPCWGRRVHALGVGPQPIMRKELTAQRLAQTIIQAITNEERQRQAAQLGEQIRAEGGIATALTINTYYLSAFTGQHLV